MKSFKELLAEDIEPPIKRTEKRVCEMCSKDIVHNVDKHKHTKKAMKNNGKAILIDGKTYCLECLAGTIKRNKVKNIDI